VRIRVAADKFKLNRLPVIVGDSPLANYRGAAAIFAGRKLDI
jgi:hypothetical protein